MRKKWYSKRVTRWNGRDLLEGSVVLTLITTTLVSIPFIGALIKEMID